MIGASFIIAHQAAALIEPGKRALYDPALAHQRKARGGLGSFDDFQVEFSPRPQRLDPTEQLPGVTAIGPDDLQPTKDKPHPAQKLPCPVAVLDGGGGHAHPQQQPQGIDEQVPLAPLDLFARIVATDAALLSGLDALAVEDGGGGRSFFLPRGARSRATDRECAASSPCAATGGSSRKP
jgi:hypothetical protein